MSGEQVRLQVPPKLYRVHSWITQVVRQWVPNCRSGDWKSPSPKGAALNTWNRQLMTSGRSQMVTTGNCGNWHTVVGEICWSPMPETSMAQETTRSSAVAVIADHTVNNIRYSCRLLCGIAVHFTVSNRSLLLMQEVCCWCLSNFQLFAVARYIIRLKMWLGSDTV